MQNPFLLLDIDGVISLFGFDLGHPPEGSWLLVDGIPHLLSGSAAALIARLAGAYELVWCSGWEEKADEVLPGALGVPRGLHHLAFAPGEPGRHWKLASIDAFAGPDRPLAWVDDAHDATCEAWAAQRPGPTKLVATQPAVGLTAGHVDELLRWRAALR
jgi:hypothetical protein